MISIQKHKKLACDKTDIFRLIDSIEKLSLIKKEVGSFKVARDEPGLQIVDAEMEFPLFIKAQARLSFSSMPGRRVELKLVKGKIREYLCSYTFSESGGETVLNMRLLLGFPVASAGFLFSFLVAPFMSRRMELEMGMLEKLASTEQ